MTSKEAIANSRSKLKGGGPSDNPIHGNVLIEQAFSDSMR